MTDVVESNLPTKFGNFKIRAYPSKIDKFPDLALFTYGISEKNVVDVRIHSECMTGDVFDSLKCDCGEQLDFSMKWIKQNEGVIIYLRQEGRGIGLVNKLHAYNLQEKGFNTREANLRLGFKEDIREYSKSIEILHNLGVKKIRILTNNPEKMKAFENSSIEVVERVPIEIESNISNQSYLLTKKEEMGHLLSEIK